MSLRVSEPATDCGVPEGALEQAAVSAAPAVASSKRRLEMKNRDVFMSSPVPVRR